MVTLWASVGEGSLDCAVELVRHSSEGSQKDERPAAVPVENGFWPELTESLKD